uniref:Uncharacterized protein n=2 Tax=Aegilops tauschii subsp. strangulata TaxID=200361 RepID=A0A453RK31_AEGTS
AASAEGSSMLPHAAEASPDPPLPAHPLRHAQWKRLATTVLARAPPPHPRPLFVDGRPSSASTPCGVGPMCWDWTSMASAPDGTSTATCRCQKLCDKN